MTQRVLFTASTASHILNFHRPYLRAFQQLGYEVHVACGGPPAAVPEADAVFGLSFEKRMSSPANLAAQRQLRALMERHRYALVCAHTSLAAFFTRRAAAGLSPRPPVVNMVHGYLFDGGTPLLKRTVLLAAEKLTAPQTDLLLTMNACDNQIARRYRLGRRVEEVPGVGVDFSRLDSGPGDRAAARRTYGFAPGDVVLLYAAEFSARKSQEVLLRALPSLPERVKLLLPGQGARLEECRRLAQTLGVADRAVFPGQVTDMAPLYALADGAVSASRSEGLPFNIMEAMHCALPIVASAVKGHTDLLTDGVTGLLYPYGDCAAFAAAVRRLLDAPELGAALGRSARAAVQAYSLERVLPTVMERYRSLLPAAQEREAVSARPEGVI